MNNKYSWIIFNLVFSIGCFLVLYTTDFTEILERQLGIIPFVFVVANFVWIYKTVIYWRKCIQADDPAFDAIVCSIQKQPYTKSRKEVDSDKERKDAA
ncbi:hypothetical protein [Vibrio owensii]|uniref:Lipoprotein n=2 Tax=Vibrio harveyi group TaxID=717610 RepID=A0A0C1WAB8_9VIBR|nr:hypothetical protein [Vibrio owensii]KIF53257.1 hypothetical protein H735_10040 [Vibrio owensii CAIM 1854 = LMG 25443]